MVRDVLVASPADAGGRGIALSVCQDGAAADLTGATVYFVWKHKVTGERGTESFSAVDAAAGMFELYYPAAMQGAEGVVQAQVMISRGDGTYISTRVFTIPVEPVIVGGEEHEDGFTLFLDAINAYEHATEVTTNASEAVTAAASAANTAAGNATQAVEDLRAAAGHGDFDGADGADGADGFSPVATVIATEGGATITIIDKDGTTTVDVAKGVKGDPGERGPQGIQGECGLQGPKGDTGDTGATGLQGVQGEAGPAGADGTALTPVDPLTLDDGEVTIYLSAYAEAGEVVGFYPAYDMPRVKETNITRVNIGSNAQFSYMKVGDFVVNTRFLTLETVRDIRRGTGEYGAVYLMVQTLADFSELRAFAVTEVADAAPGETWTGELARQPLIEFAF